MTLNTLDRFRPIMKFHTDRHFIYITAQADKQKEEIQSYYKLREKDLEEITKDWSANLLITADPANMFDPETDSSEATHKEHDTPRPNRRKKTKSPRLKKHIREDYFSIT
jgi:hypothetical protein